MTEKSRILVPVDFSTESRAAVERAASIARLGRSEAGAGTDANGGELASDVEIQLLHAVNFRPIVLDSGVAEPIVSELRASEREEFYAYCRSLAARGIEISECFDERDPAEAIHVKASASGAQLVVMGSHSRHGLDRLILGSVAERTLQGSPVPVLVVREDEQEAAQPIRSILLATDFSEDAEYVESLVTRWAEHWGAEVEVFHAIHKTGVLFAPCAVAGSDDFEVEMREVAKEQMQDVLARLAAAGVRAKSEIVYGHASDAIVERAKSTGIQLIAMGTRGKSSLERLLVGSVAQRVLRNAPCSVLIAGPDRSKGVS